MNFSIEQVLKIFTELIVIFLILPVHEYAHAWAAHKMGDDTAAYMGRLTLNPIAHLDPIGALCMLLSGGFGWAKPVPINPLKFKKQRLGIAVTAAAGPLSNLIFSFVAMILYRILTSMSVFTQTLAPLYAKYSNIDDIRSKPLQCAGLVYDAVGTGGMFFLLYILEIFVVINIGLAIFNLIPIPPLDGSKIVGYFTSAKFDRWIERNAMIVNIVFLAVIVSGVLGVPLGWLRGHVVNFFWFITGFIPKLMGA